jgi:small subunit ribosomal protein S2
MSETTVEPTAAAGDSASAAPSSEMAKAFEPTEVTIQSLLEAGVHFGHQTHRWNPQMKRYIFGARNGTHILDLDQTLPLFKKALAHVREVTSEGEGVLFVGTKRQAAPHIMESAIRCKQSYVNSRWLGGMMTNWRTISNSIKRLRDLDDQLAGESDGLTKKELLGLTREQAKLERALGGIKEMGGLPDILVVIDTNKEAIAIAEANKLNIPVVGIIDSNSKPDGITYPVPGNDDAIRAINFYCELLVGAVLDGIQQEVASTGADIGAAAEPPKEDLPKEKAGDKAEAKAAKGKDEVKPGEDDAKTGKPADKKAKLPEKDKDEKEPAKAAKKPAKDDKKDGKAKADKPKVDKSKDGAERKKAEKAKDEDKPKVKAKAKDDKAKEGAPDMAEDKKKKDS